MSTEQISRRYARAIFELIDEGAALREGLAVAAEVAGCKEAAEVLASPSVTAEQKTAIVCKASGKLPGEVERLVALLSERNKLSLLPEILTQVDELIRQSESEVVADVTVASKLSEAGELKIAAALSASVGRKVRLNISQDASLLGGLVVRIGDRQIDNSLRTRLEGLQRAIAG